MRPSNLSTTEQERQSTVSQLKVLLPEYHEAKFQIPSKIGNLKLVPMPLPHLIKEYPKGIHHQIPIVKDQRIKQPGRSPQILGHQISGGNLPKHRKAKIDLQLLRSSQDNSQLEQLLKQLYLRKNP